MAQKGKEFTSVYVPWGLRERLRHLAKIKGVTMVLLIEKMVEKAEFEDWKSRTKVSVSELYETYKKGSREKS